MVVATDTINFSMIVENPVDNGHVYITLLSNSADDRRQLTDVATVLMVTECVYPGLQTDTTGALINCDLQYEETYTLYIVLDLGYSGTEVLY